MRLTTGARLALDWRSDVTATDAPLPSRSVSGRQSSGRPLTNERERGSDSPRHIASPTLQIRMKQAKTTKRVPNSGSWKPGTSGNPNGRPRTGLAFAEAVRERIDPHRVLDLVDKLLADESVPAERRLASVLPYVHAGFVRPPTELAISNGPKPDTADWTDVPIEKRREALAALRAARAPSGAQPDGSTDDNTPSTSTPCPPRALTDGDTP